MKHRYLNPKVGRFLSQDPKGIFGDAINFGNPYTYAANNPANLSDSFGLETCCYHSSQVETRDGEEVHEITFHCVDIGRGPTEAGGTAGGGPADGTSGRPVPKPKSTLTTSICKQARPAYSVHFVSTVTLYLGLVGLRFTSPIVKGGPTILGRAAVEWKSGIIVAYVNITV